MSLSVKQTESARFGVQKERLGDGSGLFVRLYRSGRKVFQVFVGKGGGEIGRVWITLGDFPELGLKAARGRAVVVRGWSDEGLSAKEIRQRLSKERSSQSNMPPSSSVRRKRAAPAEPRQPSFEAVAKIWFERKRLGLKNGKHIQQNWNTVACYVLPALGSCAIDAIKTRDVVEVFRPIWHEKNETARRTLGRVKEIFDLAQLEYDLLSNPAVFSVDVAFGRARRRTQHFGALEFERVPEFWDWLQNVNCAEETRHLLALMLLCAKRTGEARFAQWSFFSEDGSVWDTPAELMKMGRPHRVPMSRQARALLNNMRILNGEHVHVFSKPRNKSGVICENAARLLAKRFDPGITGHGFRAAFKTWSRSRRHYLPDAIEFSLAHEPASLEAAYQRSDLLEERAALMQDWADFVTSGQNIRPLLQPR